MTKWDVEFIPNRKLEVTDGTFLILSTGHLHLKLCVRHILQYLVF